LAGDGVCIRMSVPKSEIAYGINFYLSCLRMLCSTDSYFKETKSHVSKSLQQGFFAEVSRNAAAAKGNASKGLRYFKSLEITQ
jgi:hypothetical protein